MNSEKYLIYLQESQHSEKYLIYLQESQHIAYDSYKYIGEMYEYYVISRQFDEYLQEQREQKIDEILK